VSAPTARPLIRSRRYLRPLKLALALSVGGELFLFVVWGLLLFPAGNVWLKLLWTLAFCGLGMGGAWGSLIVLVVVDRLEGWTAVAATTGLAVALLGVGCDALCLTLDRQFGYFGAGEHGLAFVGVSLVLSLLGGLLLGWLCFRPGGRRWLDRIGW